MLTPTLTLLFLTIDVLSNSRSRGVIITLLLLLAVLLLLLLNGSTGRRRFIKYVMVRSLESLPALCQAITHGLCRGFECLSLRARRSAFAKERLSLLTGAFEMDGALPALRRLVIFGEHTRGMLPVLTKTLAAGTVSQLQELILQTNLDDSELISLAEMMEARTRNPDCDRLVNFEGGREGWFDKASLGTRIRLLRVLLPSVWKLPAFR